MHNSYIETFLSLKQKAEKSIDDLMEFLKIDLFPSIPQSEFNIMKKDLGYALLILADTKYKVSASDLETILNATETIFEEIEAKYNKR